MSEVDDLEIGAVAISKNIFKGKISPRQVVSVAALAAFRRPPRVLVSHFVSH